MAFSVVANVFLRSLDNVSMLFVSESDNEEDPGEEEEEEEDGSFFPPPSPRTPCAKGSYGGESPRPVTPPPSYPVESQSTVEDLEAALQHAQYEASVQREYVEAERERRLRAEQHIMAMQHHQQQGTHFPQSDHFRSTISSQDDMIRCLTQENNILATENRTLRAYERGASEAPGPPPASPSPPPSSTSSIGSRARWPPRSSSTPPNCPVRQKSIPKHTPRPKVPGATVEDSASPRSPPTEAAPSCEPAPSSTTSSMYPSIPTGEVSFDAPDNTKPGALAADPIADTAASCATTGPPVAVAGGVTGAEAEGVCEGTSEGARADGKREPTAV